MGTDRFPQVIRRHLFSFGLQSKSSIPTQIRPRRKENEEPHANTYVATSIRAKYATDDEPEETERVQMELAHATIRRPDSERRAERGRRSMRLGKYVPSC